MGATSQGLRGALTLRPFCAVSLIAAVALEQERNDVGVNDDRRHAAGSVSRDREIRGAV